MVGVCKNNVVEGVFNIKVISHLISPPHTYEDVNKCKLMTRLFLILLSVQ